MHRSLFTPFVATCFRRSHHHFSSKAFLSFASVGSSVRSAPMAFSCPRRRFSHSRGSILLSPPVPAPEIDLSELDAKHWTRDPIAFTLTGFLAASFGGLLGLGGGVLMIPIMVSRLGVPQQVAHGTSLVAVTCTGIVGAYKYFGGVCFSQTLSTSLFPHLKGAFVDVNAAILLTFVAMPMAIVGAQYAAAMHPAALKKAFGWWLVIAAVLIPLKTFIPTLVGSVGMVLATPHTIPYWATLSAIGLGSGFLSGVMGVGGGTAMVPIMALLGMEQHLAQGTALAGMIIPSFSGALSHNQKGNVKLSAVPWLLLGAAFGAFGGSALALVMSESLLRMTCAIGLFGIGVRYIRG